MTREADIDAIDHAWREDDQDEVAKAGARLGLALSLDGLQRLSRSIRGSLTTRDIILVMGQALADPSGIALREVQKAFFGRNPDCRKEICLVVKHAEQLTVGIAVLPNLTMKIGDAWPELRPWFKQLAKNRQRAEAWALVAAGDRVRFPLVAVEHATSDASEADLIAQIVDNPRDDDLRMVLADRLLEREDVRGELIRLAFQIEQADHRAAAPLRVHVEQLDKAHRDAIAGEIAGVVEDFTIRRGFVDSVTMTAGAFRKHGDRIFRAQPISTLVVKPWNDAGATTLSKAPHLARVRELELRGLTYTAEKVVSLVPLAGFRFDRLEHLKIDRTITTAAGGEEFFQRLDAPRLRSIHISGGFAGAGVLRGLAANRALSQTLEVLSMVRLADTCQEVTLEADAGAIAEEAFARLTFPKLRVLWLAYCWFMTDERIASLAARCPLLETLDIPQPGLLTRRLIDARGIARRS